MARLANYNPNLIVGNGIQSSLENDHPLYKRHLLREDQVICSNCGAFMYHEEKIADSTNDNPIFSLCCARKQFRLPRNNIYPAELLQLLTQNNILSKDFMSKIRAYNSIFAFTSFNASVI